METALLFDTLKTSKHLQAAGFEQEQAEALTEEFKFVVESNFAKLSTKDQVSSLETSLNEQLEQKATKEQVSYLQEQLEQKATKEQFVHLQEQLDQKATKEQVAHLQEQLDQKATKDQVSNLEANLNEKMSHLETNLNEKMSHLETNLNEKIDNKFKLLSWMVGFGISLNLMTLGVVLAFLFAFLSPTN